MAGNRSSQRHRLARLCQEVKSAVPFACCNLLIAFCLLALPALATERDQGVLEIRIKDHREAIDDFANVNITVDKILISPRPGLKFWQTGWKELSPSITVIDLTQYSGNKTARVFHHAIDAGWFDGIHLKIKNINALLVKNQR